MYGIVIGVYLSYSRTSISGADIMSICLHHQIYINSICQSNFHSASDQGVYLSTSQNTQLHVLNSHIS